MSNVFHEREPFTASATATRHPKPNVPMPKKPGGVIDKVLSIFTAEQQVATKQQEDLELKKGEAIQRAKEYKLLRQERDKAALRLDRADEQVAGFQAQRRDLLAGVAKVSWGFVAGELYRQSPLAAYAKAAALDLAIADFPNARRHIEAALEEAQERLNEFQAKHGAPSDVG